jgi:hypothetical protein
MTQTFTVELQTGLLHEGQCQYTAELREPTGRDEVLFVEGAHRTAGARATALLAELVLRIGTCERPDETQIAQLSLGDRERLLLALSGRSLGNQLDLVTRCATCRTLVEIPIRFDEIIALRPQVSGEAFELPSADGAWSVLCRPLTGADVDGVGSARELLLAAVLKLANPEGRQMTPDALPVACEAAFESVLAALDPAAECSATMTCPGCGETTEALVDGMTMLQSALHSQQQLYDDVFRMANTYHWSEADILDLPLRRRQHYLAIAEAAGGVS